MNTRRERDIKRAKQDLELIEKALNDEGFLREQHALLVLSQLSKGYEQPTTLEVFLKGMQRLKETSERCLYEVTRIPQLKQSL
jgi:hypothetical protein